MIFLLVLFLLGGFIFFAAVSPELAGEVLGFVFVGIPLLVFMFGVLAVFGGGCLMLVGS